MGPVQSGVVDGLSSEELVERAVALRPLLAGSAAETESARRLPDECVAALADAGLFSLTVPRRFGGLEVPFATFYEATAAVGGGCGSSAWVVSLINICNWMASLFCDRAQQEVFGADPDARVCGVLAPTAKARRVDGGLVVSGSWGYASGCLHSTWAVLGVPVMDADGELVDQGLALVPMSQLRVEDTWFVTGMRGTGSNTLVAEEVFVPDHMILSITAAARDEYPTEHTEEALYRSAFVPSLAIILTFPQIGMARAAVEFVVEKAPRRQIAYTIFERQIDSTAFQLQVAEAAMLVETACLHVERAAAVVDGAAASGEQLDYLTRARVRADTGWAISKAREAIDLLITAHGASSFAETSPLQRFWRDSNTAGRHAVGLPAVNQELYGKALLGIPYEENITALI
jgi:3-hydroxy-9,10-secoandrosta-1,3,5(10)-triene-9,17-dione monooxygenase